MDRQEILKLMVHMLEEETGNQFDNEREDFVLREQLGVDSVDLISLVATLENKFKIRITAEELQGLQTVSDLIDLLQKKVGSPAHPSAA